MKIHNYISLVIFTSTFFVSANAQTNLCTENIVGRWFAPDKKSSVLFYVTEDNQINAKLDWMEKEFDEDGKVRLDKFNPIDSLKTRRLKGINIVYDLQCKSEKKLINGKIYNPQDGSKYDCFITINNKKEIELRGFIFKPIFGKSIFFNR